MGEYREAVVEHVFDFHDMEGRGRCQVHEGHAHRLRESSHNDKALGVLEFRGHVPNLNSKELDGEVAILEQ